LAEAESDTLVVIPAAYLDRLRNAGLLVSEPFLSSHRAFPDGHIVGKPQSVGGNAIAGFECYWGDAHILLDAPTLFLHADSGHWVVTADEYAPGPGLGDFVHVWPSADQAIADILDFFFSDSARIDLYRDVWDKGHRS